MQPKSLIRPLVRKLAPYVPGEQPKVRGLIKLNTNENPYPPSPTVRRTVRAAVDGRLRLYPNPTAEVLRVRLAAWHECEPDQIVVGNGSDELLALATRAFVEPAPPRPPQGTPRHTPTRAARSLVQSFRPSYSLYPVLAEIHGARPCATPLAPGFALPTPAALRHDARWRFDAALTFITTPNAPTGCGYATEDLARLCRCMKGVVILDETYVDFAEEQALRLALELPNVLVARTFSKAYSLCFQRVGYLVGHHDLIAALLKIKDSYNVNGLGQVAALATLEDLPYYQANFRRILATRERLRRELGFLGFRVLPSQTNFLFCRPPVFTAESWLARLREHRILVRWFQSPEVRDFLRITVGTDSEAAALLRAARRILAGTHSTVHETGD